MAALATNTLIVAQAGTTSTEAAPAATTSTEAGHAGTEAAQAAATAGNAAGEAATTAEVGHAEPSGGFPPFDASTFGAQIFWLVICFGVLYVVVARAVQPRLTSILASRRDKIDGDLAEADRLRKETDKAIAGYEAALAAARAKAHAIAEETRNAAKAELDAKRAAVEADLTRKVNAAETQINAAKTAALGKVDEIAADTATALVSRLVGTVSPEEARAAVARVTKG
jgi:F-type H+-transporting ATPase subunit b